MTTMWSRVKDVQGDGVNTDRDEVMDRIRTLKDKEVVLLRL